MAFKMLSLTESAAWNQAPRLLIWAASELHTNSELLKMKEATHMRHLQTHMQSKAGSYYIIRECFKTIYSKKQYWKVTVYIILVAAYPAIWNEPSVKYLTHF